MSYDTSTSIAGWNKNNNLKIVQLEGIRTKITSGPHKETYSYYHPLWGDVAIHGLYESNFYKRGARSGFLSNLLEFNEAISLL